MSDNNSDYTVSSKFAQAQHSQITRLQKKIEELHVENAHLRELLKSAIPLTKIEVQEALSVEESIAENEIKKLKEISDKQVLTMDECKRLVEYVKILQGRKKKDPSLEVTKEFSTEELLKKLNE